MGIFFLEEMFKNWWSTNDVTANDDRFCDDNTKGLLLKIVAIVGGGLSLTNSQNLSDVIFG
jgi:hypothetical protein